MNASQIALFGGVYSNHLALSALLEDVRRRGIRDLYCLGDLGGFGPNPDKVFPLLRDAGVNVIQGNYDDSVGNDLSDCQCGYTDPRDNYFARLSYLYTHGHTSAENKAWMRSLPKQSKFELGGRRVRLCHGSPRKINEFLRKTRPRRASSNVCAMRTPLISLSRRIPASIGIVSCQERTALSQLRRHRPPRERRPRLGLVCSSRFCWRPAERRAHPA